MKKPEKSGDREGAPADGVCLWGSAKSDQRDARGGAACQGVSDAWQAACLACLEPFFADPPAGCSRGKRFAAVKNLDG